MAPLIPNNSTPTMLIALAPPFTYAEEHSASRTILPLYDFAEHAEISECYRGVQISVFIAEKGMRTQFKLM